MSKEVRSIDCREKKQHSIVRCLAENHTIIQILLRVTVNMLSPGARSTFKLLQADERGKSLT